MTMEFERQTFLEREARTANTGLAKVAVQCSADTFVVNQSLVLRINICGENRHLRQARNRWWQFYRNSRPNNSLTTLIENSTTDDLCIYQKLVTLIKF